MYLHINCLSGGGAEGKDISQTASPDYFMMSTFMWGVSSANEWYRGKIKMEDIYSPTCEK